MAGLAELLSHIKRVPRERLVEALAKVHRRERPSPFLPVAIPEPGTETPKEKGAPEPATSLLQETIPIAPAAPSDQALFDLVEHHKLESEYTDRVRKFLSGLGPKDAAPLPESLPQELVLLRPSEDGAGGTFVIHNPTSHAAELSFHSGSPERPGLHLEPASLTLLSGESRQIAVVLAEADANPVFSGCDIPVHLDGKPVLLLRVELLAEPDESKNAADDGSTGDLPRVSLRPPDGELGAILREAQLLLLKYPLAAQAIFRSVVAEGRVFAETEEGRRLREELADSELIQRGRTLWEVGTLKLLEEDAPTMLPSKLLDAFVQAAAKGNLETNMMQFFGYGADDAGSADPTPH